MLRFLLVIKLQLEKNIFEFATPYFTTTKRRKIIDYSSCLEFYSKRIWKMCLQCKCLSVVVDISSNLIMYYVLFHETHGRETWIFEIQHEFDLKRRLSSFNICISPKFRHESIFKAWLYFWLLERQPIFQLM